MTPIDFLELDEIAQAEVIWSGKHISNRKEGVYKILLYQILDLFVEVFYCGDENNIYKFQPFTRHELLDHYLPKN